MNNGEKRYVTSAAASVVHSSACFSPAALAWENADLATAGATPNLFSDRRST